MSKTSKTPESLTSTVNINGMPKMRTTTSSGGSISSNYYMSPWEKQAYEYSQKEFANNLPNVNVFSKETLEGLSKQIDAYKASGIKQINEIYAPMLRSLQNDVASRFGNFDNSIFLDKLGQIENKRADSVNAFAQDISAKAQELTQNELANRYNYLNFLNSYQSQMFSNAMGMANTGNSLLNSNMAFTNNQSGNSMSKLGSQISDVLLKSLLFGQVPML